jgi:kelch-like protein 10
MTIFTTPLHCTEKTDVNLLGVTSETMRLLLDYAYMRCVDINQENVRTFLVSADFLDMPDLLEHCCDFLKSTLTPENCISTMRLARDYNCPGLKEAARCLAIRNFMEASEQIDELLELPPEELEAILGKDELNVKNEEVVWDYVLRWINHDEENRKGYIVELMKKVRLGLLDPKFVLENVNDHPYVAGNDEWSVIITEALKFLHSLDILTEKDWNIKNREFARPRIVQRETLFIVVDPRFFSRINYILMNNTRTNRLVKVGQFEADVNTYGTAVIGFNIYVIGRHSEGDPSNSCHCFNVVTRTWCEVSPMLENRLWHSVAVLDELVYAMGGQGRNTAERYDHRTNQWSRIAPMKEIRRYAAAATLNGKIYVAGGFDTASMKSAEVYDPEVNQWTSIAEMIFPRRLFSCIAYHGYVYSIGESTRSVEKYNPTTNEWMQIPDMSYPRRRFGTVVLDDKIFVIGRRIDVTYEIAVEYYNEKSNEWIDARHITTWVGVYLSACVIMGLPNV